MLAKSGKCDAAVNSLKQALSKWPEDIIIQKMYSQLVQGSGLILEPIKWNV